LVIGLYVGGVGLGMATGHWQTNLTYNDYLRLIPNLHQLGF